jgi:hypothetical protein
LEYELRFYTEDECEKWLCDRERQKPDAVSSQHRKRVDFPLEPYKLFSLAHRVAATLTYRRPALLWITEWGVWPSSENWHLYYKMRQAYGDIRLLAEAPGHLCLEHESEDLASFLQMAMLNGWGGYVLTEANFVNAFFSHDEYIDFFAEHEANLPSILDEVANC